VHLIRCHLLPYQRTAGLFAELAGIAQIDEIWNLLGY
jgi:hypothetical protein